MSGDLPTTIPVRHLEEMELAAADTKKEFHYNKYIGRWAWCNRGEVLSEEDFTFNTRMAALEDAVNPYMEVEVPELPERLRWWRIAYRHPTKYWGATLYCWVRAADGHAAMAEWARTDEGLIFRQMEDRGPDEGVHPYPQRFSGKDGAVFILSEGVNTVTWKLANGKYVVVENGHVRCVPQAYDVCAFPWPALLDALEVLTPPKVLIGSGGLDPESPGC